MKKVTAFIFILLLLLALPVTAAAAEADTKAVPVTAQIPGEHTVTLNGDHVELSYGGTAGGVVTVPRHSEPQILLVPDPGYEVEQVLYGGVDITASYQNGIVTLPKVWKDDVLTVITREAEPPDADGFFWIGGNPRTGDIIRLWIGVLALSGLALLAAWYYYHKRMRKESE